MPLRRAKSQDEMQELDLFERNESLKLLKLK